MSKTANNETYYSRTMGFLKSAVPVAYTLAMVAYQIKQENMIKQLRVDLTHSIAAQSGKINSINGGIERLFGKVFNLENQMSGDGLGGTEYTVQAHNANANVNRNEVSLDELNQKVIEESSFLSMFNGTKQAIRDVTVFGIKASIISAMTVALTIMVDEKAAMDKLVHLNY